MRVFYEFFLIICALLISIYFLVFTNLIDSFDLKLPSLQKIQAGAFQIFLVLATATSAAFFQWQFNKNDRNNTKIAEATRFNEAVVYLKTLIEDTRTNYADNVLQEYITEKQHVEDLNSKPLGNEYNISLTSIPELRAAQTSAFLDKIPNLGKYYQIIDAYYYAQGQIQNFNDVAIERTLSIKEQRNNSFKKDKIGNSV